MKKRKNTAPTEAAKSVAALGKNPNRFYVYALWIVGEGKPFYIGKGQGGSLLHPLLRILVEG